MPNPAEQRLCEPRLLLRKAALCAVVVGASLLGSGPLAAQMGPTLQDLAVAWASGSYGSPLICEIDGEPVRGMRRLQITPVLQKGRPTEAKVSFVEMDVPPETRCFNDLGAAAPNIAGWVRLRLLGASHPDSAKRDFKQKLKREGGIEFDIPAAHVRTQSTNDAARVWKPLGLRGGHVLLRVVGPGSDNARLLADFESPRKISLELHPSDGETISLPLFLTETQ